MAIVKVSLPDLVIVVLYPATKNISCTPEPEPPAVKRILFCRLLTPSETLIEYIVLSFVSGIVTDPPNGTSVPLIEGQDLL